MRNLEPFLNNIYFRKLISVKSAIIISKLTITQDLKNNNNNFVLIKLIRNIERRELLKPVKKLWLPLHQN
jgi:hypothetical protein